MARDPKDSFASSLLAWFDLNARNDLPWRQDTTPYRVWVSEIMLQQTQVATVIPYFQRFVRHFPSVNVLASAEEDAVMHHWTGLGYYARARNLHRAAKIVTSEYCGELPLQVSSLLTLPGIGRSTAGAIVAICTDHKAVILDGNVKRVLARHSAIAGWPGKKQVADALWRIAERLTPDERVADYTQAIMDLGATLCTKRRPTCETCPIAGDCRARASASIEAYPGRKPPVPMPTRSTCMLVLHNAEDEIFLEKRPSPGLWGGLWSFPEVTPGDAEDQIQKWGMTPQKILNLAAFRHTFTHFHLQITPVYIRIDTGHTIRDTNSECWYSPSAPAEIGLCRPVTRIIDTLFDNDGGYSRI